jgi:hypothetical protein
MTISPTKVRFDDNTMWVDLSDGRTIGVPLAWFPRLLRASPAQREGVELSRVGLHWEEINEDISVAGLLAAESLLAQDRLRHIWFFEPSQSRHFVAFGLAIVAFTLASMAREHHFRKLTRLLFKAAREAVRELRRLPYSSGSVRKNGKRRKQERSQ